MKSYISVIKSMLRDIKVEIKNDKILLASLTRACKIMKDRVWTKLPIPEYTLQVILSGLNHIFMNPPQPYLLKLYKALFVTAYYGLFCIEELTCSPHVVKANDVHIGMNK